MKKAIIIISGFIMFIAGCASREVPAPVISPTLEAKPIAEKVRADWEVKWEQTLAKARKEGMVMLYTTRGIELRQAWQQAFEAKYGIRLDSVSGRGGELSVKILAERRAGLYLVDIMTGGSSTPFDYLKPAGALVPIEDKFILPEVADPKYWLGGKHLWLDRNRMIFQMIGYPAGAVGINTNLVKSGEIKKLRDLLNPKWKEKIVINDPTQGGTGHQHVVTVGYRFEWGWDFWRELVSKQKPAVIRDQRLVVDWLALGKYTISIAMQTEAYLRALNAGAPIELLNLEEIYWLGGDVVMLMDKAPHPNAAKIFLNWILSREGQAIFQSGRGAQSARVDLPAPHEPGARVRELGVEYWIKTEEFNNAQEELTKKAIEIFGPLMK